MTGSTAQLINGVVLMVSFFGSRLVMGPYQTYHVFSDIYKAMEYQETVVGKAWMKAPNSPSNALSMGESGKASRELMRFQPQPVPQWLGMTYMGANTILTLLNVYWFYKMIETIRARFPPPFGTQKEEDKDKADKIQTSMGRGIDAEGTKSVGLEQKEIRYRGVTSKVANVPHPPPQ